LIADLHINQLTHLISVNEQFDGFSLKLKQVINHSSTRSFDFPESSQVPRLTSNVMKVNKRSAGHLRVGKKGRQLALLELGISMRRRGAKISIKTTEHDTCPRSQIFLRPIRLSPFHL
jgi:hypothetical protein